MCPERTVSLKDGVSERRWHYTRAVMGWLLYQFLHAALLLVAAPVLLVLRGRHYLPTLPGRLGRRLPPPPAPGGLWIHAVSVGEVGVAATLARELPSSLPLIVTTVTPTGQALARKLFAERRAVVTYLPFDLGISLRPFLERYEPAALVLVEGDYWPLVLRETARREMPVAVVNGRISERSFGRLRRLPPRLRGIFFDVVERFGVQTEDDRRRLRELGIEAGRVAVTGNLKFDTPEPPVLESLEARLRELADGRPILVAGSTMRGEDDPVLDAFVRLGGGERALLVLVPRHPERWDMAERAIAERGLHGLRRSTLDLDRTDDARTATPRTDVVLLDSMGELASLYRVAAAAFIGGTLVPTGGHNPLEPARFGVPVVVGPSMHNFKEIARLFDAKNAWTRVADAAELAELWKHWLDTPEAALEIGHRGAELIDASRGAAARTVTLLGRHFAAIPKGASSDAIEIGPDFLESLR